MKQIKLICLIELVYLLNNVSPMKIMSGNQCVSKSPSKLDQWCEPNAERELVLTMLRRCPLMLEERVPEGRGRVSSSLAVTTHSSGALRHLP